MIPRHGRVRRGRSVRAAPLASMIVAIAGLADAGALVVIGLNGGLWPGLLAPAVARPDLAGRPVLSTQPAHGVVVRPMSCKTA